MRPAARLLPLKHQAQEVQKPRAVGSAGPQLVSGRRHRRKPVGDTDAACHRDPLWSQLERKMYTGNISFLRGIKINPKNSHGNKQE